MVYICSPLRANEVHTMEENLEQAKRICRVCVLNGILPMAPHLYLTQFLDDNKADERECGIKYGISLLDMCEEIWVFGDIISSGMAAEIAYAKEHNIPIREFRDIDAWIRSFDDANVEK